MNQGTFLERQAAFLVVGSHAEIVQGLTLGIRQRHYHLQMVQRNGTFLSVDFAHAPVVVDFLLEDDDVALFKADITAVFRTIESC